MIFSMAKDEIHELPLAIQQKNTSYFAWNFSGYQWFDPIAVANRVFADIKEELEQTHKCH